VPLNEGVVNELPRDILECIGNTSLLALRNIVPENGARILLKLKNENPTGLVAPGGHRSPQNRPPAVFVLMRKKLIS